MLIKTRICLFTIFVLNAANILRANEVLPNATDLQAAYCLGAIQAWIKNANDSKIVTSDPDVKTIMNEIWASKSNAEKRLKVYLIPRMFQLEISALLGAKALGSTDFTAGDAIKHRKCIDTCANQAKLIGDDSIKFLQTCTANCEGPTAIKLLACEDASFLPF